ncbi:HU family DNA-binding protein [Sneathiella aquimaris]|uniref:HU family DNA-binding protein n=1 Tax=Sneathiella aquimaris TaxID=2599305 RepID=UPI00146F4A25|nr:HU family DNA-binding protein [Sneathiella aquimaris]
MPTDNTVIECLLHNYGYDAADDNAVEQFFNSMETSFTEEGVDKIGEFLLAAESGNANLDEMVKALPAKAPSPSAPTAHPLTKADLATSVAKKNGMTIKDARRVVDTALETITHALTEGQAVRLTGFGTFTVAQNREITTVVGADLPPARGKGADLQFKAGKNLKQAVTSRN